MFRPHCMAQKLLTPASGWSGQLRKQAAHRSSSSSSLTWSPSATVEQISDNLSFRPANSSHPHTSSAHTTESSADGDSSRRPVVLIYAWLAAKSRHIHKFSDFYQGLYLFCSFCFLLKSAHVGSGALGYVYLFMAKNRRVSHRICIWLGVLHFIELCSFHVFLSSLTQLSRNPECNEFF